MIRARDILMDAFATDPFFVWLCPRGSQRPEFLAAVFEFVLRRSLDRDVDIDGDLCAIWVRPDELPFTETEAVEFDALLLSCVSGEARKARQETISAVEALFPVARPAYLFYLGVCSARQRQGLGLRYLEERMRLVDLGHLPIYLEATNASNVPFYVRAGFRTVHTVPMVDGEHTIVTMLKPSHQHEPVEFDGVGSPS
jgi:ribosomal protein S18 acetylase RimI-like enzyme